MPFFLFEADSLSLKKRTMREAAFWETASGKKVRCLLCPHRCLIGEGQTGVCRVRENQGGKLVSLVYGCLAALHADPVEKKPLYHFYPGSRILSVGTPGCNLHCNYCQNHSISQEWDPDRLGEEVISPAMLAEKSAGIPGNLGVAYTYTEPTVFYEFMAETSAQVHRAGLKNVVVSNGYINPLPLERLLFHADAFNIDLKSFEDSFYRKVAGGSLAPVLESLKIIARSGKHLEVTYLLIPGLNDDASLFEKLTVWMASELGEQVPLHISRYFPAWKQNAPPTPLSLMECFHRIAAGNLQWVYCGNLPEKDFSVSRCPGCNALLVERDRYSIRIAKLGKDGSCLLCGRKLPFLLRGEKQ